MKSLLLILFLICGILFYSCKKESVAPEETKDTDKPSVKITYPLNNSDIKEDTVVTIKIEAADNSGIEKAVFFIDGALSFTDFESPFEYDWNTRVSRGKHSVFAEVFDKNGNSSSSGLIVISVLKKNLIPYVPGNPFPADSAYRVSSHLNLSWSCFNPGADSILYDVYLGTESNPVNLISSNQTEKYLSISGLKDHSKYYWKVTAKSKRIGQKSSPVLHFTTGCNSVRINDFEWINVPSGTFTYGENDEQRMINYDYKIMKYKVTNSQYLKYLQDALAQNKIYVEGNEVKGYYSGDEKWGSGNYTFYYLGTNTGGDYRNFGQINYINGKFVLTPDSSYAEHPVVFVSWCGAWAFAGFYGFSLPTEEEWEKTARGNTGYNYPWGNTMTEQNANFRDSYDPWDNGTTPVGYYNGGNHTIDSPSPFGAYDMAGNVWEWTDGFWDSTSAVRTGRGGSWHEIPKYEQSWLRDCYYINNLHYLASFRCVDRIN